MAPCDKLLIFEQVKALIAKNLLKRKQNGAEYRISAARKPNLTTTAKGSS